MMPKLALLWLLTQVPVPGSLPPPSPVGSVGALSDLLQWPRLEQGVQCRQFASTDPSARGDDHGHFLALAGRRAVLARMTGPGCVVRIWSANPQGRLLLYCDGEATPRVDAPFADVLAGKSAPFREPFATHRGGGWVSYLPIAYAQSCRIEVDDLEHPGDLYYHVQYLTYATGTPVRTFTRDFAAADARAATDVATLWSTPGRNPIAAAPGDVVEQRDATIAPGETLTIAARDGAGIVLGCHILPTSADPQALRALLIGATFDDQQEPSVLAPVGDFFGVGFGVTPFRSLALGWDEHGGYAYLPMPFRKRVRLALRNHGQQPIEVHTSVAIRPLAHLPADYGTLHAEFRSIDQVGEDRYEIASIAGAGKYVGCTCTLQGVGDLWYLEGNEQFVVDGASEPQIVGTGSEDFFNGGWYWDTGPFAAPLWGLGRKQEWTTNQTTPFRLQLLDAVPFAHSLSARIEHGSANAVRDAAYASVAFWYGDVPRAVRAPSPAALKLPRLWVKRRPGAIAAASLPWTSADDPPAKTRWDELAPNLRLIEFPLHQAFPVSYLERAQPPLVQEVMQLRGRAATRFSIAEGDRYAVRCSFVGRPQGAEADLLIDGQLVGHVTTEASAVGPLPPPELLTIGLERGEHVLELHVLGSGSIAFDSIAFDSVAPFVRAWWVAPPVTGATDETVEATPPAERAWLAPGFDPRAAEWREVQANEDHLDLNRLVSSRAPVLGYLMTFVHAPRAQMVRARLGSDDGVRVWVNGELTWSRALHRHFTPDEDRFDMPLAAGWNRVLVKVRNDDGGYAMSLRFGDPAGNLQFATRHD